MAARAPVYTARKVGAPHTLEHRIYIEKDGVPVSPFHDIPLYANEQQTVLNMIVEIPRWTNAKQEVSVAATCGSLPAARPAVTRAITRSLSWPMMLLALRPLLPGARETNWLSSHCQQTELLQRLHVPVQ